MKIYIDNDFKCYAQNDGSMREVEAEYFNGKCKEYIEGYRYVPVGEQWTRPDGTEFCGEMLCPWKDYKILDAAQQTADRVRAEADEQIMQLLDVIEELIVGG